MIDNTVTAIDDIIGGAGGVGVGGEDAVPVAASIIHVHGEWMKKVEGRGRVGEFTGTKMA